MCPNAQRRHRSRRAIIIYLNLISAGLGALPALSGVAMQAGGHVEFQPACFAGDAVDGDRTRRVRYAP